MDDATKNIIDETYKQGLNNYCTSLEEMVEVLKLSMANATAIEENHFTELYDFISILSVLPKDKARKLINSIYLLQGYEYCGSKNISVLNWGILFAVNTADWQVLTDALYTHNRLAFATDLLLPNGYNHTGYIERVIFAFAACDLDLVEKYLPKSLGLGGKDVHPFLGVIGNLVIGLYYKEKDQLKKAVSNADKFVQRKGSGKGEVLVVRYLLALIAEDMQTASEVLQAVIEGYRRMLWLHESQDNLLNYCAVYVHGLYNLARFMLPVEAFSSLSMPNHPLFIREWVEHQKKKNFSSGSVLFNLITDLPDLKGLFSVGWVEY